MSSLLGDARIRLRADTTGFEADASRSISGAMKKVAGVASAALAAVGVAGFGKDLINLASNAEQSIGGVEAVFKSYSDTVLKRSKEADRALGLSGNAYRELSTLIGAQLKNAGTPMDQLGGKTDALIKQGADLAAMFGGTTEQAVSALSSALKGEMDPIEKYGISLNDAALKAEVAALGIDVVGGSLSNSQRAMAVMSLVTKQGADAVGAFGRESDTAAGRQARATAQWENLKTTIGEKLLPVWSGLMDFVGTTVLPGLEKVGGIARQAFDVLFKGDFTGGPLVEDSPFINGLFTTREVLGNVADFVRDDFVPVFQRIGDFVTGTVVPAFQQFGGYLRENVLPIVRDVAAWIGDNFAPAMEKVGTFATEKLLPAFKTVGAFLVDTFKLSFDGLVAGWRDHLLPAIGQIIDAFKKAWPQIQVVAEVLGVVAVAVGALVAKFLGFLIPVLQRVAGFLIDVLGNAISFAIKAFDGIVTAVQWVVDAYSWMNTKTEELRAWIVSKLGALRDAAVGIFVAIYDRASAIWTGLRDSLVGLAQNVWDWVVARFTSLRNAAVAVWTGLKDTVVGVFTDFRSGVVNTAQNIWDNVTDKFGRMRDGVVGIFTGIKDTVGALWDSLLEIVKKPVRVVLDFLNNSIIGNVNKVTKPFGLEIPTIKYAFASGGIVPGGYSPGRDTTLAAVGAGEAVMRPEWTRAMGATYVNAANAAARTGGVSGVKAFLANGGPGFASGGVVGGSHEKGGPLDWAGNALSWAKDGVTDLLAKGAGFALKSLVSPAVDWITNNVGNEFVSKLAAGAMRDLIGKVESWGNGKDSEALAGAASDVRVPGAAGGSPGTGYQALFRTIKSVFPEARLNSGFRPGDPGYHGKGLTADLGWMRAPGGSGNAYMAAMNQWIYDNYPNSRELIYNGLGDNRPNLKNGRNFAYNAATQAQHRNHVHWVYDNGGLLESGQRGVNLSGKPERVLNPRQTEAFEEWMRSGAANGGPAPLVGGDLVVQVAQGTDVKGQIEEVNFQLRKIQRGGRGR